MTLLVLIVYVLEAALLIFGAAYLYYDWKLGVAAVPSSSAAVRKVAAMLPGLSGGKVVDLGSGWGGMALAAARACPDKQIVGIEYALLPYLWSRMKRALSLRLGNLRFLRADFFGYSLADTQILFIYMPSEFMPRLAPKIAELPKGAYVISNSEKCEGLTPESVVDVPGLLPEKIYVYRV